MTHNNTTTAALADGIATSAEPAVLLFDKLHLALHSGKTHREIYREFKSVFNLLIDQNTENVKVVFRGPYPKTDYLLKEHNASWPLRKRVHGARVNFRNCDTLSDDDLKEQHLHDLKALCQFIALIYGAEIPSSLSVFFPKSDSQKAPSTAAFTHCVRMIVAEWDDDYFYGKLEDMETEHDVRVAFVNEYHDWKYLSTLFFHDRKSVVNLVRPRWKEPQVELSAEVMIFEPDYLVDISSVAACFEQYGTSPYVHLLKKIKPQKPTAATILGNIAGEILDKTLHSQNGQVDLRSLANNYLKSNPVAMLSLTPGELQKLWDDIKTQAANIKKALYEALPSALHDAYCAEKVMVEPSFFVEMLGLQGRMDFFQTDGKLILEQKSGKGGFPQNNYTTPIATEQHIVQVTLYMYIMRYAFRESYEENKRNVQSFLLYSKYSNSLYSQGFNATDLLFTAIEVRNRIAWCDDQYAESGAFRWLGALTPAILNKNNIDTPLWNNWQRPEIEQTLGIIRNANALEKAYFYRMMSFVAKEHLLSKIGNKTKANSGFAAKWYDSLADKLTAGTIYSSLQLTSPHEYSRGNVEQLVFKFKETEANDMANFRVGDIVVAYPYDAGGEPDVRKTMVFRCTIESITAEEITLRLRSSQTTTYIFLKEKHRPWAIEHDFFESSFSGLYRGIYSFLATTRERRQLLLLQREPEICQLPLPLQSNVDEKFRLLASKVKQARDFFLIIGPPGTGKTSHGLMTIVREQLAEEGTTILLMSYTNRAVDEMCEKLIESKIDFLRIGNPLSASAESRRFLLCELMANLGNAEAVRRTISETRVVVGTTTALTSQLSLFQHKQFSLAIIDEASQILEPHLLPLLSATCNGWPVIRKFVMIGDHKQLPAVVQQTQDESRVDEEILHDIQLTDCRHSLFERLLRRYSKNENVVYMLTRQGRMHPDIAAFPNYAFYANKLEAVPVPHQKHVLPCDVDSRNGFKRLLATRRISFLAVDSPKESPSDKVNLAEAEVITQLVKTIYETHSEDFKATDTVGVIVPYRNQIATIRNLLLKTGIAELADITIDTVERYQGSQRKFIIYGFTIQQYYQLQFLTSNTFEDIDGSIVDRKLNVAMTRAKECLIMVGNPYLLSNNFTFYKLIEFVRSKNGYFEAPFESMKKGDFEVPVYENGVRELSTAVYETSACFQKVFDNNVVVPIQNDPETTWPKRILGLDMQANLEAIGYGRINFSNQLSMFAHDISAERQVLIYCYYIMRQHYCSSVNIYNAYRELISAHLSSTAGRMQFIDIGCGPATCGVAFYEMFRDLAPQFVYTGIDISVAMKAMAKRILSGMFGTNMHYQLLDSLQEMGDAYWQQSGELPTTVVINLSYFFSNIKPAFAERLALQIKDIMQKNPLNKFIFIIQQGECDRRITSYATFCKVLKEHVQVVADELAHFSYQLGGGERRLKFNYAVWSRG